MRMSACTVTRAVGGSRAPRMPDWREFEKLLSRVKSAGLWRPPASRRHRVRPPALPPHSYYFNHIGNATAVRGGFADGFAPARAGARGCGVDTVTRDIYSYRE